MFNDNIIKISSCCKKHYAFIADQMAKKVAFNETQQITIFHTIWCSPHAKLFLVCVLQPPFLQFDNITHFPFAGVILLYISSETYCSFRSLGQYDCEYNIQSNGKLFFFACSSKRNEF